MDSNAEGHRNLLLISEGFPPDSGGVATSTRRLAENLTKLGLTTTILTYQRGRITELNSEPSVENFDGYKVVRLGPFFKTAGADQDFALNEKHKALFRRRFVDNAVELFSSTLDPPDLVFSMYLLNAGFLATHIAGTLGIPHVAGVRGNDIGRNLFDPTLIYTTRLVLERASAIACVNRHLHSRMLRIFPDLASKSSVINNSIEPAQPVNREAKRLTLLAETGWPIDCLIACFVGNFREKKGCLEIIEALEDLHDANVHSPVRMLLIAPPLSTTERVLIGDRVRRLVERGIVHHELTVGRESVRSKAVAADILLQPSLEDGMANALLEGMSVGLCPVVSPIFADVVRAGEGLVLTRPNRRSIAEAITVLSDPVLRQSMGAAARRRSVDFQPSAEATAYADLFEAMLTGLPLPAGFEPGRTAL